MHPQRLQLDIAVSPQNLGPWRVKAHYSEWEMLSQILFPWSLFNFNHVNAARNFNDGFAYYGSPNIKKSQVFIQYYVM